MGRTEGTGCLWEAIVSFSLVVSAAYGFACIINPCIYGICIDSLNGSYSCYCIDGYTGVNCQTNWDECWSSPCHNGGTCHDGVAAFNCTCPDGFAGDTCEENVDECGSNPCYNNGTCIDIDNGYVCQCLPGYAGIFCEIDVAICNVSEEERCMNGGICVDGPGITFNCQCLPGWTGKLCQTPIDECASSPCKNGAVCVDMHATYVCACPFGFTGKNCELGVELCAFNTCENNALCVVEDNHSVCYCVPDFHGDRCQYRYDECQKGPGCLNGGICVDGVDSYSCSCPPGLTGRFCECIIGEGGKLDCNYVQPGLRNVTVDLPFSVLITTIDYGQQVPVTTEREDEVTSEEPTTMDEVEELSTGSAVSAETIEMEPVSPTTEMGEFPWEITDDEEEKEVTETEPDIIETATEEVTTTIPETTEEPPEEITDLVEATSQGQEVTTEETVEEFLFTTETPPNATTEEILMPESTTYRWELVPTMTISSSVIVPLPFTDLTTDLVLPEHELSEEGEAKEEGTDLVAHSRTLPLDPTQSLPTELVTLFTPKDSSSPTTQQTPVPECTPVYCKNGGTCYSSNSGPRCECRFGWTGSKCEAQGGIRVAAFSGDSHLVHRLTNTSRGVSVSLKMRTLAHSGLILYTRPTETTYMALYLESGLVRFQFSCGLKSMLLSQLYEPVNTGYPLDIMAMLELTPGPGMSQQCSAVLRVNDTLAMSGEQPASPGPRHSYGVLYLGGLPHYMIHQVDVPIKSGIIACMCSLEIDGEAREIYTDAVDGNEISECSSLACLSGPCKNGATCAEFNNKWQCLCPTGYVGETCEESVCDNNPCRYGGTCVQYPASGFICLCPFGKHGLYCDQDLEIGQPFFSSSIGGLSSYTAYPLPGAIHHSFELRFQFIPKTVDQIALMVFIGQDHPHDSTSDHLAVSFIKGYVVLTWNLGSGPRRIFTPHAVSDTGKGETTHTVRLGRLGQRGWLQVDNMPNVTGTSPGWLSQLNTQPIIYIGGYESYNFSGLPHDLPLHTGYSGCLYDLELRAGRIKLDLQRSRDATGRNVGQCSTSHCHESSCLHGGACLDHAATFTCLCQDGWFGPECTLRYNPCDASRNNCTEGSTCVPLSSGYECDCPLGKTGKYCELVEPLSDVSLSGKRSFLSLPPMELDLPESCVDLELRPLSGRGLVLFTQQNHGPASTFLSLSLQGGVLELRLFPLGGERRAGEVLVVRSGRILGLGEWTRVRAGKYGRRIFLWVDGTVNAGNMLPGETLLPGETPLYIGGLPDLSDLPSGAVSGLPIPFKGCVRKVSINWRPVSLDADNILESRNIADCDGTPCGADVCLNGGTCHITRDNTAACSCPKEYQGERCETLLDCTEIPCENNGRCVLVDKTAKCHCPIGWAGPFCNREVNLNSPHFTGDSYLVVDPAHMLSKRGSLKMMEQPRISNLYLNFSTAQLDGMLLWTSQEEEYLGIGVEGGLMKIVWGGEGERGTAMLLAGAMVSDGAWHTVSLRLRDGNLTINTDTQLTHSYTPFPLLATNGIFYLGGFPEERSLRDETGGSFHSGFNGCIKEFAWEEHPRITNFAEYDGENLANCDIYHP